MTDVQRARLVEEARLLVGVPFQHAGRSTRGLDCVGLLVLATRNAGMDVYDNPLYSPVVDSEYMQAELAMAARRLTPDEPTRMGDVLLFRIGRSPQHLALVSSTVHVPYTIIHAYQTVGRVVEQGLDPTWASRLADRYEWRPG